MRTMSRIRLWSPFFIASVGGTVAVIFEAPIGEYLSVYNPLMGYLAVEIYAGFPIGFVAALVSASWRGLATFVLGLLTAGATVVIVGTVQAGGGDARHLLFGAFYFALWLGLFGVPTYVVVTAVVSGLRWARGRPA
jgi:hypothetical protein